MSKWDAEERTVAVRQADPSRDSSCKEHRLPGDERRFVPAEKPPRLSSHLLLGLLVLFRTRGWQRQACGNPKTRPLRYPCPCPRRRWIVFDAPASPSSITFLFETASSGTSVGKNGKCLDMLSARRVRNRNDRLPGNSGLVARKAKRRKKATASGTLASAETVETVRTSQETLENTKLATTTDALARCLRRCVLNGHETTPLASAAR